jgi:single-strand DNA-binding protein
MRQLLTLNHNDNGETMNKAILVGNLGADPELRHTQGDQAVLNLRMATSESWVDRDGEKKERTDWHNVVIWGKRGEALAKFLTKGSKVLIEGRIQTREYEKDGQKRYATDIVAMNVELLGGRSNGDDRGRDDDRRPAPRDDDRRSRDDDRDRGRREPPPRDARRDDRRDRRPAPADDFAAPGGDEDLPF